MSEPLPLFPYQRDGVDSIVRNGGVALQFDDCGLGKSVQCLTATKELNAFPCLIIAPASLLLNWRQEIEKWLGDMLPETNVVLASKRKKTFDGRIVIVSYGMAWRKLDELKARKFRMVIADEAVAIKDPTSLTSKAVVSLMRQAPCKIPVTGTPILNEVVEVFPLLKAVGLIPGMSYVDFGVRYAAGKKVVVWCKDPKTGERMNRTVWDFSGRSNEQELNALMVPLMIRRFRADVLPQLPEMIRTMLPVEPHVPIRGEREVSAAIREALEACGRDVDAAIRWFQAQFAAEKEKQPVFKLYQETGLSKAPNVAKYLIDSVSEHHPTLVFAHHLKVLSGLEADLRDAGVLVASISGATPSPQRQKLVDDFQAGKLDCLILSLTAASTGLTLTRAREIVFAELPWNPLLAHQAEARAYRIGQKNALVVRYAVTPESLDDTLWAMLDRKALTAGAVIDGDEEKHRLHVTASEGPVVSVLRSLFEDELIAMRQGDKPKGRWKPNVSNDRVKTLAA